MSLSNLLSLAFLILASLTFYKIHFRRKYRNNFVDQWHSSWNILWEDQLASMWDGDSRMLLWRQCPETILKFGFFKVILVKPWLSLIKTRFWHLSLIFVKLFSYFSHFQPVLSTGVFRNESSKIVKLVVNPPQSFSVIIFPLSFNPLPRAVHETIAKGRIFFNHRSVLLIKYWNIVLVVHVFDSNDKYKLRNFIESIERKVVWVPVLLVKKYHDTSSHIKCENRIFSNIETCFTELRPETPKTIKYLLLIWDH